MAPSLNESCLPFAFFSLLVFLFLLPLFSLLLASFLTLLFFLLRHGRPSHTEIQLGRRGYIAPQQRPLLGELVNANRMPKITTMTVNLVGSLSSIAPLRRTMIWYD